MCFVTKWVEAFATPDQCSETIAQLFVDHVVCRHGVPEELLSDRGANFLSDLTQSVCKLLRVRKINTSTYHPQTDGLVERFNSTLIGMISNMIGMNTCPNCYLRIVPQFKNLLGNHPFS